MTQTLELVNAFDAFIRGCKADGTWNSIKSSCIMAGWNNLDGALTPLVGTAPTNFNFWGPADPHWANVSLLLRMNGANGSTTFTDSSNNALTVTRAGNAQISTTQSKFGGASTVFDGNGDALTAPNTGGAFSFSSNTYTFEAWIYPVELTGFNIISSVSASAVVFFGIIYIGHNGSSLAWGTRHDTGSGIASVDTSGGTLALNTWQHVALSVSAGSAMAFINGTQVGSTVTFTAPAFTPVGVGVGNNANLFSADESFNGYIDDFRITKGVARYTANFTPPTQTHPGAASDYDRKTGLQGSGSTKRLDLTYDNNQDSQNNAHMSAHVTALGTGADETLLGGGDTSFNGSRYFIRQGSTSAFNTCCMGSSNTQLSSSFGGTGLYGASRSNSSNFILRTPNLGSTTVTQASSAVKSGLFRIFSTPFGGAGNSRLAFYSIGGSLDLALLDSRVTTLVNDIAAAIP